jgi:peroxin-14
MATPVREDVLASAVAFLRNPKVQESPLARRIAFLESKGLTAAEVQEALARAGGTSAAPTAAAAAQAAQAAAPAVAAGGPYPPGTVIVPAALAGTTGALTERVAATTWKDAFIGVVLAGGATYAAVKAFQVRVCAPFCLSLYLSHAYGGVATALGAAEPELAVGREE